MSGHTPGPWEVGSAAFYEEGKLMEPIEYFVRQVGADVAIAPDVDTLANARLMAAAPDLLEACSKAYLTLVHMNPNNLGPHSLELVQKLLAACAKAEGR